MEEVASGIREDDAGCGTRGGGEAGCEGVGSQRGAEELVDGYERGDEEESGG
jgi:hypothetical protein